MYIKRKLALIAIITTLFLSACGGGGSDSHPTSTETPSTATSILASKYYGKWSYVDSGDEINILSTSTLKVSEVADDENLLIVDENGTKKYLVRSGLANTTITGKIETELVSSSSSPRRASSFAGIANIKIILSNYLDARIREETETLSDGSFTTTTLPSGTYHLEAKDESLELSAIVEISNQENDIGVYKLTGSNLHNFKAELILNEEYVVSDEKTHEAVLRIHNISNNIGFGLSYDIALDTNDSVMSFTEGSADSLGSVQAKSFKDIPISFAFNKLDSNIKEYGIDVTIKDAVGNQWIDTFNFNVQKELVAILIKTDKAAIKGYLKNPITGEMKVIDTANGNILVPLMPEDKPYTLILSNPSFENETKYSIGINRLPEDLSTFKDTAAQEPNNDESKATSLNINSVTISYLHATDIDFWKIYTNEGVVVDTTLTQNFTNTLTPPSSAPVLVASDGEFIEKIILNWNSVNSATYYEVSQATALDGEYIILENTLVDTSLNLTSVFANTTYFYKVKACNDEGCSDFSSVNSGYLLVPNNFPVANAGDDFTISGGSSIDLNASLSSDNDGSIVGYQWLENSKVLSTNIVFTLENLSAGIHEIVLVVTDDRGANATDTTQITVSAIAPVADAGVDKVVFLGSSVSLSASGSSDSDGSIVSYLWKDAETTLSSLETFSTSSLSLGIHTITLKVTDNDGAVSTDTVAVRVNGAPQAVAGDDITATLGDTIAFDASLSSDDNGIVGYQWFEGSIGLSSEISFTTTLSEGSHIVTLKVSDADGVVSTDTLSVLINPVPNVAPTADAGEDVVALLGTSLTLDASESSDSDGTLTYLWKEGTTTLSTLERFTTTSLSAGLHTITLTVRDDDGAVSSDTLNVRVNSAPIAVAGDDITAILGDTITFDASSSSDDNSIVNYQWFEGSIGLSSEISFTTTLSEGTHTITLKVSDADGAITTDTLTVLINPVPNIAPTANAGLAQTVTAGSSVTLDASLSSDSDGAIVSYRWYEGTIELSTDKIFVTSSLSIGEHTISLGVTDDKDSLSSDSVLITITEIPNVAPAADAISSVSSAVEGSSITFSGANSSDSDGSISAYLWSEGSTTLSQNISFILSTLSVGQHTIVLTVTDDDGAIATDSLSITITQAANVAPIANAGVDKVIAISQSITFDASASTDSDGSIESYLWEDGTTFLATTQTFTSTSLVAGVHTITLTVRDDDGAEHSDTLIVRVNSAPVANAGVDKTIDFSQSVTLDATLSSDDISISSYQWLENSLEVSATQVFTTSELSAGIHTFTLLVSDEDSETSSDTVIVTVNELPNVAPIANAGLDQVVSISQSITFDASASTDSDGNIVSYLWLDGSTFLSTSQTFTLSSLSAGSHTISLTITDNDGDISNDTLLVRVNVAPVANAGEDKTVEFGAELILTADLSSDDIGINIYQWLEDGSNVATTSILTTSTLSSGSHTFTLVVTDIDGESDSDTVVVLVNEPPNVAPIANAGLDRVIQPNEATLLSASDSNDSDGNIVGYSWTEGVTLLATTETFTISTLSIGTHTITLTVTDNDNDISSDEMIVKVNNPPVAVANDDITILVGESINFDANSSSDSDGSIISYLWQVKSTTIGTTAATTKTFNEAGVSTVYLTVTDSDGASSIATTTVTVLAPPIINTPSVVYADENQNILLAIDATNPNGSSLYYSFGSATSYYLGNDVDIDTSSGVLRLFERDYSGANNHIYPNIDHETKSLYQLKLTVTDSVNNLSTIKYVDVIINDLYEKPIITTAVLNSYDSSFAAGQIQVDNIEAKVLTYSLSGGMDAGLFNISSNGVVTYKERADISSYTSAYKIQVTVSDDTSSVSKNLDIRLFPLFSNGITYSYVVSPTTGRVWLDKNIGANDNCSDNSVNNCGYYFQWAREIDGHQTYLSSTSAKKVSSTKDVAYFVLTDDIIGSGDNDWYTHSIWGNNAINRQKVWAKTDGSSICPHSYRVPTIEELNSEFGTKSNVELKNGIFKITPSGYRSRGVGSLVNQPSIYLWSQNYEDQGALTYGYIDSAFAFSVDPTGETSYDSRNYNIEPRSIGMQVRCIQN